MVLRHGAGNIKWSVIAAQLPGRIGKQCRERWFNHLDPDIKKGDWTPDEDAVAGAEGLLGVAPHVDSETDTYEAYGALWRAAAPTAAACDSDGGGGGIHGDGASDGAAYCDAAGSSLQSMTSSVRREGARRARASVKRVAASLRRWGRS